MRMTAPWSLLAALVLVLACDSSSPVAPAGTIITVSASPSRISINGQSLIRVVALKPNGTPINPGTIVRFSSTLGQIEESTETDDEGVARAVLRGNGQAGQATVTASTGTAESATVEVQIGFIVGSITIQATPSSVSETGGVLDVLALVRDDQGQPLPDASVNFKTEVGTLESGGRPLESDGNGQVQDTLTVTQADLDPVTGDSFPVQAEAGGVGGSLLNAMTTIAIQRLPRASFTSRVAGLTVVFTDTSTGRPTAWMWDFGDGNTSRLQNPTREYAAADTYVVTLTVTNSQGSDTVSGVVAVTGQ